MLDTPTDLMYSRFPVTASLKTMIQQASDIRVKYSNSSWVERMT